jgi:hypothetical protein
MDIIVIVIAILVIISILKSDITSDDIDRTVPQDSDE